MKRLTWLLVPAVVFALGAAAGSFNLPSYVPSMWARPRTISEFEYNCIVKRIYGPIVLRPGILITQQFPGMNQNALLVSVTISPDPRNPSWKPPAVPEPEAVISAIIERLSKHFNLGPDKMIVIVRCGNTLEQPVCFALHDRGRVEVLAPEANPETRRNLSRKGEKLAGPG
jgi:hypothetical protein